MGDLANMTSVHGEVDGFRLLRWLRSRSQIEHELACEAQSRGQMDTAVVHMHMAVEFGCMADDLEQELTPPDYPDDDGDERSAFMSGPHDPCKRSPGVDDEGADLDDKDTGPCEACGRLADRVPVRSNGRVFFACPGCAAREDDDAVNLDDPALTDGP